MPCISLSAIRELMAADDAALVAYLNDVAVGCSAMRQLEETTAEIKRMSVDPSVLGAKLARLGRGPGAARRDSSA